MLSVCPLAVSNLPSTRGTPDRSLCQPAACGARSAAVFVLTRLPYTRRTTRTARSSNWVASPASAMMAPTRSQPCPSTEASGDRRGNSAGRAVPESSQLALRASVRPTSSVNQPPLRKSKQMSWRSPRVSLPVISLVSRAEPFPTSARRRLRAARSPWMSLSSRNCR